MLSRLLPGHAMANEPLQSINQGSSHSWKLILAIILLLLPLSARTDESEVQGYLLSVNRLYEALEYEQALRQLERAQRFANTVDEDVALSLYEAVILADMNRWKESAAAFKAALFLRPDATLPLKVSPKVDNFFETVRQEVKREIAISTQATKPPKTQPPQKPANHPSGPMKPAPGDAHGAQEITPSPLARTPSITDAHPMVPLEKAAPKHMRPQVLIPAIGGSVLMLAGGTSWMMSRKELSRLRETDTSLATREDARRSASRGRTYQNIGIGLIGAGLAGLGIATGFFISSPSNEKSLSMTTDGTSTFVYGRWP